MVGGGTGAGEGGVAGPGQAAGMASVAAAAAAGRWCLFFKFGVSGFPIVVGLVQDDQFIRKLIAVEFPNDLVERSYVDVGVTHNFGKQGFGKEALTRTLI